jgi:hypothetical protein
VPALTTPRWSLSFLRWKNVVCLRCPFEGGLPKKLFGSSASRRPQQLWRLSRRKAIFDERADRGQEQQGNEGHAELACGAEQVILNAGAQRSAASAISLGAISDIGLLCSQHDSQSWLTVLAAFHLGARP